MIEGTNYIMNTIHEGTVVKHFKYETLSEKEKKQNKYLYRVISTDCMHTETEEEMVVYQAMYEPYKTFVRPKDLFFSLVDKDKYPFIKQQYKFERI